MSRTLPTIYCSDKKQFPRFATSPFTEHPLLWTKSRRFNPNTRGRCRFGSLRLNLVYDGLLLGMQGEGHKESPDEAPPCASTFNDNIIINTSVAHFAGRSGLTQWRSSGLMSASTRVEAPRNIERSSRRPHKFSEVFFG
jgi:hypothetical protein